MENKIRCLVISSATFLSQIFEVPRMKFTEIPRRLQPLLAPPDPIVIHHLIKYARTNQNILCSLKCVWFAVRMPRKGSGQPVTTLKWKSWVLQKHLKPLCLTSMYLCQCLSDIMSDILKHSILDTTILRLVRYRPLLNTQYNLQGHFFFCRTTHWRVPCIHSWWPTLTSKTLLVWMPRWGSSVAPDSYYQPCELWHV